MKKENLLKIITLNEWLEEVVPTRPAVLDFFGRRNFIFSWDKSRKSQGILKRDVYGKHMQTFWAFFILFQFPGICVSPFIRAVSFYCQQISAILPETVFSREFILIPLVENIFLNRYLCRQSQLKQEMFLLNCYIHYMVDWLCELYII